MRKTIVATAIAGACGFATAATAGSNFYFSDFETDDGGWVNSGSGGFAGDWEWEANYDASNYTGAYVPPANAYSGTGMWGTLMYDDHTNSGAFSILSQTFDFSGVSGANLSFASWSNVFGSFDYNQVVINGDIVASSNEGDAPYLLTNETGSGGGNWVIESIDISAYDGLGSVTIEFRMWATTVVNRPGWYLDDVAISAVPAPGALALLGLAGLVGRRRRA